MSYIVIEKHGGWEYASIVTDVNGNNKVFDDLKSAKIESNDCQDGTIIGDNIIELDEQNKDFKKLYTEEQVLDLIFAIDQGINPKTYETSKNLDTEDFLDLAVCKAEKLGLLKKLSKYREENKTK